MANIKDLKKKIKSTKGTLKITSAMKLVSAAKLNRAQHAITSARPYASELESTIKTVSALVDGYTHTLLEENECEQDVLLVISSNKGLCGGYNAQLAKEVRAFLATYKRNIKVDFIGKKVWELIRKQCNVGEKFDFAKVEPSYDELKVIGDSYRDLFEGGKLGRVYVAYNSFNSAISFTPTVKQVLPLALDANERESLREEFPFDFKYEPDAKSILDAIIPKTFVTSLYTSLLDALASEHGSRMAAMDSASNNCKDAIRVQTLKMNKLRQAAITTELIEVVSGAESLNA